MTRTLSKIGICCIFLMMILAAPAAAITVLDPLPTDYPMFHANMERTGSVLTAGPLNDTLLWSAEIEEWADGSPAVVDGNVYIPTWSDMNFTDNDPMGLVCCNASTGATLWTNELGGASVGSVSGVAVSGGCVYLDGTDGKLYCIDETTGATHWSSDLIDSTGYYGLSSSPLVYNGTVYALSTSDGVLHAFTLEGAESWNFSTGGAVGYFISPALSNGKIYCAGDTNTIFCIDASTHARLWSVALPAAVKSTPVVANDMVYVTTADHLYALGATTGIAFWNATVTGTFSTPAVSAGTIVAGSSDGLHAYNATTGAALWTFDSKQILVSPVIAGDMAYFATNEETGTLYAVNLTTGSETWSYVLPSPGGDAWAAFYMSSPAVSDGVLYIGAENNRFYAFGTETPGPTVIWDGTVSVMENETFTFVPSNNASASYTVNCTTDLGALEAAATDGGFTFNASDSWYADYGSFMLEDIDGIANENWTQENARSWTIFINGAAAPLGLGANDLADGDELTFYYCPTDPDTWAPLTDEATYVVSIDVDVSTATVIWDGTVTLTDTTFDFVPSNNASASYTVNRTTDLGALDTAATNGGFTFNASDSWYADYGSFMLEDIEGIANEDWTQENARSWTIFINGAAAPLGLGANDLADGDELTFYYCPTDPNTWAPLIDQATYVVSIDVNVTAATVIWDGTVSVIEGKTFTFVPSNNASASYTVNCTTDLGALDAAATNGGFTFNASDAWYAAYGSFMLEDIDGIANEDWTQENARSWTIFINGAAAPLGLGANDLADGDKLTFYYCPTDPNTWAPLIDQATYVVSIDVDVSTATVIWDGTVTLTDTTFDFTPSNNASVSYTINRTTDLGALDVAATDGGFTFNASDAWYAAYGSFLLEDIDGIANEDWTQENARSWTIFINGAAAPLGLGANDLADGDELDFYYCPTDPNTWAPLIDQATYTVSIDVDVANASVETPSPGDGQRGGFVLAGVNATAEESGWYVVVVSGTNAGGEGIAGTGTVHLNGGETVDVPVLVAVPAQVSAGTYTLYAGIYRLDDYPTGLISHSGGSECIVS